MPLTTETHAGCARARFAGELTIYTARDSASQLAPLLEAQEIELDLSDVTEIDSAGFQLLALVKREATAAGKPVRYCGHSPAVLRLLDLFQAVGLFGDPVVIPWEEAR